MCVCVRVCALWKRGRSLCISIYVRRTILFPFIGGCGVCGEMSVAHFHTPIVSHSACTCGGCRPWLHFHHIIHGLCWDLERDCCECVCVLGGIAWRFLFFIFHVSIQQGNVLPYLGHHGVRETAWYCSQENTSFSWQRRTGHCLSLELLLLTDELKIPQRRWDACRKADARSRALIRRSSANTPITFLFISFFSDKACELFLSSPGVGTEQTWIFMCTDVCIFACLSTVTCGTEKGKETDTFSISISPSFRSLQTHNVLRLMCVRVGSSVCDCKGGGIGIGRKVKHYLTALCSDW